MTRSVVRIAAPSRRQPVRPRRLKETVWLAVVGFGFLALLLSPLPGQFVAKIKSSLAIVSADAGPVDHSPPAAGPAFAPAGTFRYPVGRGAPTHCNDGDGYYVSREFLSKKRCGQGPDDVDTHLGEDWNGEGGGNTDLGEPILAIAAGRVEYAGVPGPGWGPVVIVHHLAPASGFQLPGGKTAAEAWSLYAHLSRMDVAEGDTVSPGRQLGLMGNDCGDCYAHLHFEIIIDPAGPFPGGGYYSLDLCPARSCGRVDPSAFIDLNRRDQ